MCLVNTKGWKEFQLIGEGGLFHSYERGKISVARELQDGDIPYVGAVFPERNNGIVKYVAPANENQLTKGNCIVMVCDGAAIGCNMYHEDDFVGTVNLKIIRNDFLNKNIGLFLCAALNQSAARCGYSYFQKRNDDALCKEMISLPATPDGQPDWAYMDAYMSEVLKKEEVFAEHLASLMPPHEGGDAHLLDTNGWKAFHLYDIFDIDMGNKFDRGKMPVGDAVNFVGRTGNNNGVNAVCGFVDGVAPYDAGALTLALGGTIGACFVQTDKFYTSQNVVVLFPRQPISLMTKCFLSKIIWHVSDMYYDAFSNELNKHIKTDFVFYLPITSDGQPDWAWMEQYMQQQIDKAEALVEHLDAVWG